MIPLFPIHYEPVLDTLVIVAQARVFGPIHRNIMLAWDDNAECWHELHLPWYRRFAVAW